MSLELYYDRDAVPVPMQRWSELYGDMANRRVRFTKIVSRTDPGRAFDVSTVWLGLDHNWGGGPPLIFETMVFAAGDLRDLDCRRYATLQGAEAGHVEVVCEVAATVTDPIVTDVEDPGAPLATRPAAPASEPAADLLARIDEVTTEPAARCWQCQGALGKSVSDDFCSSDCQTSWHAARVEPLTNYREAGHDFRSDAVRFQGAEPQGEDNSIRALPAVPDLDPATDAAATRFVARARATQARINQAPAVVPQVYADLLAMYQRISQYVDDRPRALRFTQEQWDELYPQLRPLARDAPERLEDPAGSRMFGLPIELVATVEESTPYQAAAAGQPRGREVVRQVAREENILIQVASAPQPDMTWVHINDGEFFTSRMVNIDVLADASVVRALVATHRDQRARAEAELRANANANPVAETSTGPVALRITHDAVPLTIECTIDGHPFWYRSRHSRWELYQGCEQDISGVDDHGHLAGTDVAWIATGECTLEDSLDPEFARRTILHAWQRHVRPQTLANLRSAYGQYRERRAAEEGTDG